MQNIRKATMERVDTNCRGSQGDAQRPWSWVGYGEVKAGFRCYFYLFQGRILSGKQEGKERRSEGGRKRGKEEARSI